MGAAEGQTVELQRELAECKARLEASTIYAEQTTQSMERRYQVLMEKYKEVMSDREGLSKENGAMVTEMQQTKEEAHKLQTAVMKLEAEQERYKLQLEGNEREKVSLTKALGERNNEVLELQTRLDTLGSKIVGLTKVNGDLEIRLQSALNERSSSSLNYSKLQQEKEILEKSSAWMNEELERRAQAAKEERQKNSQVIVDLQSKYFEAQNRVDQLTSDTERLHVQLKEQEENGNKMSKSLRETRELLASKEESFEKELALAQRMAKLYKENSDEHSKRADELEKTVSELQAQIEKTSKIHMKAIAELEEAVEAAEQKAAEEKDLRERLVASTASASLAITPTPNKGDKALPNQLTPSDLYGKFIEAEERLRQEKLKNKEREIYMEDLLMEVEKKLALIQEQKAEYESMKESHTKLLHDIEVLSGEKRTAQHSLKEAEIKIKSSTREIRSFEQQVKDLGQQVSRLLYEASNGSGAMQEKPLSSFSGGDAGDVTTQFLVEFSTIQELQEQNQKLLKVNRDLSIAAEATKAEAQEELREIYEEKMKNLKDDLEDLRRSRQNVEDIMNQVVRQRDSLRHILQKSGGDLAAGRDIYAGTSGKEMSLTQVSMNDTEIIVESDEVEYKKMYDDLEEKFKDYQKKADLAYTSLEHEFVEVKNENISIRKEVSHAMAQVEFEKDRSRRLSQSLDAQQKHLESLITSNTKYQTLINETERRSSSAQQTADGAEEKVRSQTMRLEALEAEKRILETAERRLASETAELSQEKFRLAAELDIKNKQCLELEANSRQEISKYQSSLAKVENELSDAQRELSISKARTENALKELTYVREELERNISKLENKLSESQSELTKFQQRATSAEAKADLLQEAVRKAEERVAKMEMEKASRVPISAGPERDLEIIQKSADQDIGTDVRISELNAEIKMLREELSSAQEAAAASKGHVKQFEALAHTAEEALKSVQNEQEKFKADAENRRAAQLNEIKQLSKDLANKSQELSSVKDEHLKLKKENEMLKTDVEQAKKHSKNELDQALCHLESEKQKVISLTKDIGNLTQQLTEAKKAYDSEVLAHGDALRRVASSETGAKSLQARLDKLTEDLEKERSTRLENDVEKREKIENLSNTNRDLVKKLRTISNQRDILQAEIEKAVTAAGEGGSNFKNTLRMLRQEKEAAEINLQLAEKELTRLKAESVAAQRAAEEAKTLLQAEISKQNEQSSEKEKADKEKVEQYDILRESNSALRADSTLKQARIKELELKLLDTERRIEPLQLEIKNQQATIQSLQFELKTSVDNAARWEKRARTFSEKGPTVAASEHEKIEAQLKTVQEELQKKTTELEKTHREKDLVEKKLKAAELKAQMFSVQVAKMTKDIDALKTSKTAGNDEIQKLMSIQKAKVTEIQSLEQRIKDLEGAEETLKNLNGVNENKLDEMKKARLRAVKGMEKAVEAKKLLEADNVKLKISISSLETQLRNLKELETSKKIEEGLVAGEKCDSDASGSKRKLDDSNDQTGKKLRPTAPSFSPLKPSTASALSLEDGLKKKSDIDGSGEAPNESVKTEKQVQEVATEIIEAAALPEEPPHHEKKDVGSIVEMETEQIEGLEEAKGTIRLDSHINVVSSTIPIENPIELQTKTQEAVDITTIPMEEKANDFVEHMVTSEVTQPENLSHEIPAGTECNLDVEPIQEPQEQVNKSDEALEPTNEVPSITVDNKEKEDEAVTISKNQKDDQSIQENPDLDTAKVQDEVPQDTRGGKPKRKKIEWKPVKPGEKDEQTE